MNHQVDDIAPYQELACAIIRQAIYDYRKKDERHNEAVLFLKSPEAQEFCIAWGVDLGYIGKRLEVGR